MSQKYDDKGTYVPKIMTAGAPMPQTYDEGYLHTIYNS